MGGSPAISGTPIILCVVSCKRPTMLPVIVDLAETVCQRRLGGEVAVAVSIRQRLQVNRHRRPKLPRQTVDANQNHLSRVKAVMTYQGAVAKTAPMVKRVLIIELDLHASVHYE